MLNIGDTLTLKEGLAQNQEAYKCMVVEMNDHSLFIDYPVNMETGKVIFLPDGTQLKAVFSNEQGAAYMFSSDVLTKIKGHIPMVQISLPPEESFIKIQRREFMRLEASLDAAVHPLNGEFPPFRTLTEDISAGGTAIRLQKNMKINEADFVYLWIALPFQQEGTSYLKLKCAVIRETEKEHGIKELSLRFVEMEEKDTQTIIRYIFEVQLEMKKKGLVL
ncbi:flagellar brake protein [Bacillus massiliglaciei]|uniref:flagellar brake protein n=1 Tax=Bacillus massiliglaciei TaxID=1816693 RepID=UPI000DA635A8|nr:flagellar brake domain-containing protein [Bacillus massiliglaciei]